MNRKKRPSILPGATLRELTGCGNIYVTVNRDPVTKAVFEVFAHLGKAGGCAHAQIEAITKAITTGLRFGIPGEEYTKRLRGIKCPVTNVLSCLSCSDAIAKILEEVLEGKHDDKFEPRATKPNSDVPSEDAVWSEHVD